MPVQADVMFDVVRRASQLSQDTVRQTYETLFDVVEPEDIREVPLEDVFTMLDRARRSGETIRGLTHEQIAKSCAALIDSIRLEFNRKLHDFDKSPYLPFFQSLVDKRQSAGQESDPCSIITLNWDTICDFMIYDRGRDDVVVDYACYDYDLLGRNDHVPSIIRRAIGRFTLKLLKLHGSLNWLICTSCGRLFSHTSEEDRPPVALPSSYKCRFCNDESLESLIITPTLLKDIGHTHLKMVWHNALMDLQEARRIVFVGYSFPLADFEFRYCLLKAMSVRSDVKIRVVLYPPSGTDVSPERLWKRNAEEQRFIKFFGITADIQVDYMDAVTFMADPGLIWDW